MTAIAALSSRYTPLSFDLTAEEVQTSQPGMMQLAMRHIERCSNTMAFRIAVPPLALWAVLYSLVEYLI
jgi:hypothetical protein